MYQVGERRILLGLTAINRSSGTFLRWQKYGKKSMDGSAEATMSAVVAETGPDVGVPWHYGDPMREQRLLTGGEGLVDLSHRVWSV